MVANIAVSWPNLWITKALTANLKEPRITVAPNANPPRTIEYLGYVRVREQRQSITDHFVMDA